MNLNPKSILKNKKEINNTDPIRIKINNKNIKKKNIKKKINIFEKNLGNGFEKFNNKKTSEDFGKCIEFMFKKPSNEILEEWSSQVYEKIVFKEKKSMTPQNIKKKKINNFENNFNLSNKIHHNSFLS